jgi:serine/threonine protein kinase/tetratricopeptide (TPR) repeat protein
MISERIFEEPASIGPYRIINVIGRGGMGIVFRAQHEQTGELVALKKVLAARGYDLGGMRREIDALRRLRHPGIVRIGDQGVEDGVPWYAMELLEGETLAANNHWRWQASPRRGSDTQVTRTVTPLRSEEPSEPRRFSRPAEPEASDHDLARREVACGALPFVLTVIRRLCSTLAFVHGEGVVHRDLKSANVVLCEGGAVKLLDFGLAWRFPGAAGREVLDDVTVGSVGTAGYMAPEQIRGEMVDARADLYSLGCVVYELLTGRLPFSGHSAAEVRARQLSAPALPPSLLVDGVPRALDELVLRLLEKRVEDRFGHANEVAELLSALGADADPDGERIRTQSYVYRAAIVGREEPLELLDDQVSRALDLQGGVVLISGESGIGKTYLAMAAARAAANRGMSAVTGCCAPHGAIGGQPNDALLHPFRNLLLAIADRCIAAPELTFSLLGERAKVLAVCEPSLASLPSVTAYPDPETLPAKAAQERLLSALADTIAAFAQAWPLALLIDDLQWADELSLRFLSSLPDDWFAARGVLLIGMYRADEETGAIRSVMERPYTRRVALERLREPSIVELVRGMLAIQGPPPGFVDLLERQSAGNPFFVAEYLRTAVAERLLLRTPNGRWEIDARLLAADPGETLLELPSSIMALVGRRLAGLSPGARHLLSATAVLGREVDRELLLSVAALSDEEAWEPTRELIARQILEEVTGFELLEAEEARRGRLRFLHDKIRETVDSQMSPLLRQQLHRRAALAVERRFRGSSELPLVHATLAHHHRQGGQILEAIEQLELAGEHALTTYLNREALGHFRTCVELDASSRTDARRPSRAAELRRARWERKQAEAYYGLGDLESVDRHVARALQHTGHPAPQSRRGWALSLLRDVPEQVLRRILPRDPARLDPLEQEILAEAATAMHHLAERSYFSFDPLPMIAASLRSVNLAERAGVEVRIAEPYAMLGMTAGISKLHVLGNRYFELARGAARATGDDAGMVYALYAQAAWRTGDGAWEEVRELCEKGAAIAQRIRDVKALGMAQTLIAHTHFYTGRFRESAGIYHDLELTARRTGDRQHLSWGLYAGARARMALGDLEEARVMLLESNELLEQLVEVPSKIIAPGLLGSLHLRLGDMDRALECADLTTARIRKTLPTVFSSVAGYAGAAEVYLARWAELARRGQKQAAAAARKVAKRAVFDLRVLSINIPIGEPYYQRLNGEAHRLDGKPERAKRAFAKGMLAARRLGMRHDEALAHLDLARMEEPASALRAAHLACAERMLEELGCRFDLERAQLLRKSLSS